jgi:hypothetical protein
MLGRVGLLNSQSFDQFAGGQFAIAQSFHDRDPRGIGERLEDFALELPQ